MGDAATTAAQARGHGRQQAASELPRRKGNAGRGLQRRAQHCQRIEWRDGHRANVLLTESGHQPMSRCDSSYLNAGITDILRARRSATVLSRK